MKGLIFLMDAGQIMICLRKVNLFKQYREIFLSPPSLDNGIQHL